MKDDYIKYVSTDDLILRWNMMIDGYIQQNIDLKNLLIKLDKARQELLLIREELLKRNIDIDKERELSSKSLNAEESS